MTNIEGDGADCDVTDKAGCISHGTGGFGDSLQVARLGHTCTTIALTCET
jgi:hypothetical protein